MTDAQMQLRLRLVDMIDGLRQKARIHRACADGFDAEAARAEEQLREYLRYDGHAIRKLPAALPVDLPTPRDTVTGAAEKDGTGAAPEKDGRRGGPENSPAGGGPKKDGQGAGEQDGQHRGGKDRGGQQQRRVG